jgi:uncharacterized protein YidB (DUF937 family)
MLCDVLLSLRRLNPISAHGCDKLLNTLFQAGSAGATRSSQINNQNTSISASPTVAHIHSPVRTVFADSMPRDEPVRPRKSRLSTNNAAIGPLGEASTTNSPGIPINNDMAEKANRRKSAHFGDLGVSPGDAGAPVSSISKGSQAGKRVVSALAMQAGREGRRQGKRLSAVNPEMVGVSWEQRESKYEEWMKAAIDNVSKTLMC